MNLILKKGVVGGIKEILCENFDLLISNNLIRCFLFNSNPLNFTTFGKASNTPEPPALSYFTNKNK